MTEVAPIRRHVSVATTIETAFALFTAHIGAWWPLAGHSVHGEGGSVAFEGGLLVERSAEGLQVWGEVTEWSPPTSLRLTWHPGRPVDDSTDVAVSFRAEGDSTLVTVVHSGWELSDEAAERAASYREGWALVLDRFSNRVTSIEGGPHVQLVADDEPAEDAEPDRWYALVHTPGPILADGGSVFAHPLFMEHVAFLQRLGSRGMLVAAGPLAGCDAVDDQPIGAGVGSGMTIVRVAAGDPADIVDLARKDDQSVVGGLLDVVIQPWDVRFTS